MRFLLLTQYFRPEIGAVPVRLGAVVKQLHAGGHEVEVVTGMPNYPSGRIFEGYRGKLYRREVLDGLTVHRVWMYAATGSGMARVLNYVSFAILSLLGLMRATRPDYLVFESPPPTLAIPAWIAAGLWRARLIANVADPWVDAVREMGFIRAGLILRAAEALERWSYRRADYVNVVTDGLREILIKRKHVDDSKILFLPNGVDTDLFHPRPRNETLAAELGLDRRRCVLYTGVIGFVHGVEVAIEAFAQLQNDRPDVVLLLVGGGSDEPRLRALVEQRGLTNVRFLPPRPVEDIAELYSIADIGLVTVRDLPLFDGFRPSKLMSVMASGKPVVYSGRGEGAEIVEAAQAGIVVAPERPGPLADAIRALLNDPQRAAEHGSAGRRYCERYFQWRAVLADWLAQLRRAEKQEIA